MPSYKNYKKSKMSKGMKKITKRVMKRRNAKKVTKNQSKKKIRGGGYNMPHRYFGAEPNANFTSNGELTTAEKLEKNFFWNKFEPKQLF